MEICISMLKCNKIIESKAPNLKGCCVFDLKAAAYFIAMIHFPKTRLHGRLELERGAVCFHEKEPSHWTIHFLKTRLHGICDPSRMWGLRLHKPSALFP